MPRIIIKGREIYNEETNQFYAVEDTIYNYEHSLVSVSKWESITKRRYISTFEEKVSIEDLYLYIKCMITNCDFEDIDDVTLKSMTDEEFGKIRKYLDDPMTATSFYTFKSPDKGINAGKKQDKTSSELIYYWMFSLGIPKECEEWNFNRLLTLIRVFAVKEGSGKMSKKDQAAMYSALSKERRAKTHK